MAGRAATLVTAARRRLGRLRRTRMMVRDLGRRVERQRKELRRVTATAAALEARLAELERTANIRAVYENRLALQVAAAEEHLGRVDQRLSDGTFVADDAGQAQARDLVEEVRREHAQVRARLQVISAYEERIRRLETVVAEVTGPNLIRPV